MSRTADMTLHGVFMEILDLGVLVCGASGAGKGELALELVTRGHRLIADDAPEFHAGTDTAPQGTCPPLLQDMLEVRGLGVLNIRALFGAAAIAPRAVLALRIHLQRSIADTSRTLTPDYRTCTVLGRAIPAVTLSLIPGRNTALLVETLVRDFKLRRSGYDAAQDFVRRQRDLMQRQA
ncbi:MAG: hypothetical protein O2845_00240 [Proteobacteria bacterium]|nr:hypothetical protein [Pseudomonadota bacterium]